MHPRLQRYGQALPEGDRRIPWSRRRQRGLFAPQVIQAVVVRSPHRAWKTRRAALASVGECNAAAAASYQLG